MMCILDAQPPRLYYSSNVDLVVVGRSIKLTRVTVFIVVAGYIMPAELWPVLLISFAPPINLSNAEFQPGAI